MNLSSLCVKELFHRETQSNHSASQRKITIEHFGGDPPVISKKVNVCLSTKTCSQYRKSVNF